MTSPALGVVFRPQLPPEDLRGVATAADRSGLDQLWLWEDCFLEGGFTTAATALAWTENLNIHVGVFPVPLRNAALAAMEVATLARMFPGRFHPGFGHGVQDWMGQVGARVASPLTLLDEYVGAVSALLRGETVDVRGRYVELASVTLDWPPQVVPSIGVAATGPRTLEATGRIGDWTVLTSETTPDGVTAARTAVQRGRDAVGRTDPVHLVVYVSSARESGGVTAGGTAAAIAAVVREYAAAGADSVVLEPTPDEPDPVGFVEFVAQDVAAAL
ncbi:oxidoreductase [Rhodococcoides trifolii]|uniref:Oxidoreductase n=1 Tax=Rhodococcoides trifolii TaxID=908250 RepID=A0A917LE62_9NOCA|nr:LLM class flavin-dependent oxidoreductase [Rhodococcus trifolii]GGG15568.1 oxidoreductase [Rhodococcus trifolii]